MQVVQYRLYNIVEIIHYKQCACCYTRAKSANLIMWPTGSSTNCTGTYYGKTFASTSVSVLRHFYPTVIPRAAFNNTWQDPFPVDPTFPRRKFIRLGTHQKQCFPFENKEHWLSRMSWVGYTFGLYKGGDGLGLVLRKLVRGAKSTICNIYRNGRDVLSSNWNNWHHGTCTYVPTYLRNRRT